MYKYDPWDSQYKSPFGAVELGTEVTFRFYCDDSLEVRLVIHRDYGDGDDNHSFLMKADSDSHFYEVTLPFDKGRGLYYYHFELIKSYDWGKKSKFYGKSALGSVGQLYENFNGLENFQLTVFQGQDTAPDWYRQAVFYQIFPDRFCNGNYDRHVNSPKENSFIYATESDSPFYVKDEKGDIARWDFYGGNLRGIIEKIPYLRDLGVTALYLNPIFLARSNHRYDTSDYLTIDPMLGTEEDFRELVERLHSEGMHLILDGVFNHVGQDSRYFNRLGTFGENVGAARNSSSPYFSWFKFKDYPFDYESWWGNKDLPEVDKNNPTFRNFIYGTGPDSVLSKWNEFGIDGWRLDVADELPDDFIRGIRSHLQLDGDKILIGEVWEDASNKIAYNQRRDYILGNGLQGLMNYPFRKAIIDYLNAQQSAEQVANAFMTLKENYPRDIFYNNLNNIGTHDTERILSVVGEDKLSLAIAMMFMLPGVPCVYYGDEAGLSGGKDPENRKFFPWKSIRQSVHSCYRDWIKRRKSLSALIEGELVLGFVGNVLGILRFTDDEKVFCAINPFETQEVDFSEMIFLQELAEDDKIDELGKIRLESHSVYYVEL